jgi:hypothetical protein
MLPYLVLLRMGFTVPPGVGPGRGELLPHPFTLAWRLTPSAVCFLLPVMMRRDEPESDTHHHCPLLPAGLSVTSRCPAVSRHPALWSPDFPLRALRHAATVWTTSRRYYTGQARGFRRQSLRSAKAGCCPPQAAPAYRHSHRDTMPARSYLHDATPPYDH